MKFADDKEYTQAILILSVKDQALVREVAIFSLGLRNNVKDSGWVPPSDLWPHLEMYRFNEDRMPWEKGVLLMRLEALAEKRFLEVISFKTNIRYRVADHTSMLK